MTLEIATDKYNNNQTNSLKSLLNLMPSCESREFETALSKIQIKNTTVQDGLTILEDENCSYEISYKAFFMLCYIYRRSKDFSLYGNLLKKYNNKFSRESTFGFLKSMYLCEMNEFEEALNYCKTSLNKVSNNVGIMHCYCDIVASYFEDTSEFTNNEIDIYYKEAISEVKKAIHNEDSNKPDYSIRITEYNKYLLNIAMLEKVNLMNNNFAAYSKKADKVDQKIDDTLVKNLEFLGFFTGIISFIISSIQLLNNQSLDESIQLIIILGGMLMIVFSGFSIIISKRNSLKKIIILFLMGLVTVIIGILIRFIL